VSDTFDTTDFVGRARIVAAAGARYWVHQEYDSVRGTIRPTLQAVDEARARTLIEGCDYVVVTGAPEDELLPGERPIARASR